jgi:hypothetical protein
MPTVLQDNPIGKIAKSQELIRQNADRLHAVATKAEKPCSRHGLKVGEHCDHMEEMLQEIPGDFCEGEGDYPKEAVAWLRAAWQEAVEERDAYRSALADMVATSHRGSGEIPNVIGHEKFFVARTKAIDVLRGTSAPVRSKGGPE